MRNDGKVRVKGPVQGLGEEVEQEQVVNDTRLATDAFLGDSGWGFASGSSAKVNKPQIGTSAFRVSILSEVCSSQSFESLKLHNRPHIYNTLKIIVTLLD